MPKMNLTDTNVRNLPHQKTSWFTHHDRSKPGLRLCVTSTAKTWYVAKWDGAANKTRQVKLGRFSPQFGVKAAWKKAQDVLAAVDAGEVLNQREQKAAEVLDRPLPTYREALEHYIAHRTGARASGKSPMKPETVAKYQRAFDLHLGRWAETCIDRLPTVLINEHLNALQRTMPHGAQYAHGVAGTIIRHAMKVHAIVLPIPSLTDPTSTAKRRVDRELPWRDRWAEIEAVANVYIRAVWELRWHMGSRENVLRELCWNQVDLDAATVTFARLKKSEKPRRVALSDYSHSVFRRLHEARRSDFVFWSAKADHVFKLDRLPLTAPGDLRHLWTEAAMSVVAPYHLMRWLNGHNLTGDEIKMLGHYGEPDLASQREAANRISNYVLSRCGGSPSNVLELRRTSA